MKLTSTKFPFYNGKSRAVAKIQQSTTFPKLSAPAFNHFHRHLLDKNPEPFLKGFQQHHLRAASPGWLRCSGRPDALRRKPPPCSSPRLLDAHSWPPSSFPQHDPRPPVRFSKVRSERGRKARCAGLTCTHRGCRAPARCGRRSRCAPATPPRAAPSPPSARPPSPAAGAGPWPWPEKRLPSRAVAAAAAAAAAAQMGSATCQQWGPGDSSASWPVNHLCAPLPPRPPAPDPHDRPQSAAADTRHSPRPQTLEMYFPRRCGRMRVPSSLCASPRLQPAGRRKGKRLFGMMLPRPHRRRCWGRSVSAPG